MPGIKLDNISTWTIISYVLIALAIIALIGNLIYIAIVIYRTKKINTNGLLIFKLDLDNNTAIRLSDKKLSGSINFDSITDGMTKNQYIELNDFLNYFDDASKQNIRKYLTSKPTKSINIFSSLNTRGLSRTLIHKDFKRLGIMYHKNKFLVKFYPGENIKDVYCTIHWILKPNRVSSNVFKLIANDKDYLSMNEKYYVSLALNVSEYYYTKKLNEADLDDILKIFELDDKAGYYYLKDGILQIILATNSEYSLEKMSYALKDRMEFLNQRNLISPYFTNYAILSYKKLETSKELQEQNDRVKYLIHHLANNKNRYKYGHWLLGENVKHEKHFKEFQMVMRDYENKNEVQNFSLEISPVRSYSTNRITNVKIIKNRVVGFKEREINFFDNIAWYKIIYTNTWNKYILENSNSKDTIIVETCESDLQNLGSYKRPNTIFMLKSKNLGFNFKLISRMLQNIETANCGVGLYIDDINDRVFNYITIGTITIFIVAKELIANVEKEPANYIKLCNLIDRIKQIPNAKIIFENVPNNLDSDIIKRLNIRYYYNLE